MDRFVYRARKPELNHNLYAGTPAPLAISIEPRLFLCIALIFITQIILRLAGELRLLYAATLKCSLWFAFGIRINVLMTYMPIDYLTYVPELMLSPEALALASPIHEVQQLCY